jgi:hypothetical protein
MSIGVNESLGLDGAGAQKKSGKKTGGGPGKSQKGGQQDQDEVKELGGGLPQLFLDPLVLLAFLLALPWAPGNFLLKDALRAIRVPLQFFSCCYPLIPAGTSPC